MGACSRLPVSTSRRSTHSLADAAPSLHAGSDCGDALRDQDRATAHLVGRHGGRVAARRRDRALRVGLELRPLLSDLLGPDRAVPRGVDDARRDGVGDAPHPPRRDGDGQHLPAPSGVGEDGRDRGCRLARASRARHRCGWNQQECDAYGIDLPPLKQRFDMFDEACEVLIALLSNTTSDFAGTHYPLTDARCEPKPVQKPHPPICIGGGGEQRTLRGGSGTRSIGTCRLVTSRRSSGSERCSRSIARRSTVTRRRSRLPRTCASILRRARRRSLRTWPNGARAASISASSTCRRPTSQKVLDSIADALAPLST